jgi:hypothetical protein
MSDALERIKNRQRPEVPKRDPAMANIPSQVVVLAESNSPDIEQSKHLDIQISTLSDEMPTSQSVDSLKSEDTEIEVSGYSDIQISTLLDKISFPVKQTTLRLEKDLSDDLQALCQREQICREVLIEAMFLDLLNAPESREGIVAQARERQRKRTAIANHKRALSMVQRVSNQP